MATQIPQIDERRVQLMGVGFDALTESATAEHVLERVAHDAGGSIATPNLDVMRLCAIDAELRAVVNSSDLVVADGTPLVWASRVAGTRLPERVAGSSLIFSICELAAHAGASVFLLGGNVGAAAAAADSLTNRYPGLRVAGTHCPPHGFEDDPTEMATITRVLEANNPAIVFVGLPFEKQTMLIAQLTERMPERWFLGCGISLSFAAGEVKRAPEWVQRSGLEWLHRLIQEPRRLGRRYLLQGPPALVALLANAMKSRTLRRLRTPRP